MLSRDNFCFTPFPEPSTSDTASSPPLHPATSATAKAGTQNPFRFDIQIKSILQKHNAGYLLVDVYSQNQSDDSIVMFEAALGDEQHDGYFITPNEDGEYVGVPSDFAETFTLVYKAQVQHPNHLKCFPRIILFQSEANGTCLVLFEKTRHLIDKLQAVTAISNIIDELEWLGLVPDSSLKADGIFVTNLDKDKIYIDLLSVSLMPYRPLIDDGFNHTFIVLQLICCFITGEKVNLDSFDTTLKKKLKEKGVSTSNVKLLENLFSNNSQDAPEIHTLAELGAELQSLSLPSPIQKVLSRVKMTKAETIFSNEFLNIQILAVECKRIELPVFEFCASSIEDAVRRITETFSIENSKYQEKKENVSISLPFASAEEAVVYTLEKYTIFNICIVRKGATIATTFAGKVNKRGFSGPYALALPLLWGFSFLNVSTDVQNYFHKYKLITRYNSNPRLKDPSMAWCIGQPPKAYVAKFSNIAHQLRHEDKVTKSSRWVRIDYLDAFYDFVSKKKLELLSRANK